MCIGVISAYHGQDFGYKYVTKHDGHYGHHGEVNTWGDNGAQGGLNAGYGHYQDYYVRLL